MLDLVDWTYNFNIPDIEYADGELEDERLKPTARFLVQHCDFRGVQNHI